MFHTTRNNMGHQSGISLVEIMVTVLIFAVGSLGIASLQLAGLKYSSGSYARTQITILTDDMANKLKSNRAFALNENPNGSFGASPYVIANFTGTQTVNKNCVAERCTAQELVNYDLATWTSEIARTIPSGLGRLQVVDTATNGINDRQFQIQIQWRQVANSTDPNGTDADEVKNITYRVSL